MEDRIDVAWRVLTCIQNHTEPVEADVERLRSWVDPQDRAADDDDLAYLVIATEVQRGEEVRNRPGERPPRNRVPPPGKPMLYQ
jgi:hypothetical protein